MKIKVSVKNGMYWEIIEFDTNNFDWNGQIKTETDQGWPVIVEMMSNE